MRTTSALALLLTLAGCDRSPEPAPILDAVTGSTPAGEPVAPSESLAGEFRVAGVGGNEINLPYAITASVSADRIHLVADCVNLAWAYRFEDGKLATERVAVEGCGRGLTMEEEALAAAFDGADKVSRLPSGAYEITGRGPSAMLFTQ
ncbi:hypothetical protein [Tsuneonella sp. HG222]